MPIAIDSVIAKALRAGVLGHAAALSIHCVWRVSISEVLDLTRDPIRRRYCTASRAEDLRACTEAILHRHGLNFALDWNLSGEPFLTLLHGVLRETVVAVCRELCSLYPEQSIGGGTSDGRFIAPLGAEVVEVGPANATIHKVGECVSAAELEQLPDVYQAICERLLTH